MKKINTPLRLSLFAGLAAAAVAPLSAQLTPISFDFGTDPGKTSFVDAGFTSASTNATTVEFNNGADGVTIRRSDTGLGGFESAGLFRDFTANGLGGGATNNFTVSTSFTITEFDVANINNDRFGSIHLFADTADAAGIDTGIYLGLLGDTGADNDDFSIRSGGPNGSNLLSGELGYDFAVNDVFDLSVDGTFSGTTLTLDFSVIRNGGTAQTLTTSVDTVTDAAILDGNFTGVSERFKDTTGTEYDTFSVIPEPSAFALIASALTGLLVLRRRRG